MNIKIKSDKSGVATDPYTGKTHEGIAQENHIQIDKGEWIKPTKTKKGIKTKDEFIVDEAEFTGGHPENVKFEESVQFKYGDHGSDFSEIEQYAMKKHSFSNESVGEVSRAQRREGMWG